MATMTDDGTGSGHRSISLERLAHARFRATNARGGTLDFGTGEDTDFTPVELLLVAIAGCSAIDVDFITGKRAEPAEFSATATGEKVRDADGNHLDDIQVTFSLTFPSGEAGDQARDVLPKAIQMSHDRLCTVSRTVQRGTPVAMLI